MKQYPTMIRLLATLLLAGLFLSLAACGRPEIPMLESGALDLYHADLSPYIQLGQYRELEISYEIDRATEAEIEEAFVQYTDSLGSYDDYAEAPVDRPTEANDFLLINFEGYYGQEQFEGGTAREQSILLAENNGYIDWFEDDLYGVNIGDTIITSGTLPDIEGYGEMANKFVTFHITVLDILGHYNFPEVTDELIREKTGHESIEAYKAYLGTAIEAQKKAEVSADIYSTAFAMAVKNATILALPEQHVQYHYDGFYSAYSYYAEQNNVSVEELLASADMTLDDIRTMAEEATKEDLVFYAIAQAEGIEITDEEYTSGLAAYAENQETSPEELETVYGKDYIFDCLLYDETLLFIAEAANVSYTYKGE